MPSIRASIRTPIRAAAVVLALAVALGLAAPSWAQERGRDAAHDVRSRGQFVDSPPRRPEPARRIGDITTYKVAYGAELVVTTRFCHLPAIGDQEFSWFWRTADDEFEWYASLVVLDGKSKGELVVSDPEANQLDCGNVILDRPKRTVTLRLPASCLGDPAWVRMSHGVRVWDDGREYADDARREGVKGIGAWKLGPKVDRT